MALALRTVGLEKLYPMRRGPGVRALRGVSVELESGSTLGIVGESGCGKSTLARLLVGLERPSAGSIELFDEEIVSLRRRELARSLQLVFQDPYSSLDPRLTAATAIGEVLAVHDLAGRGHERESRIDELLGMVALAPRFAGFYPHELSGGQAQRVAIARALAVEPRALVLDEPTSALDVSVRAEVINLLVRLQDELSLSYVFISHDLATVRHVADVIDVMYLGLVVESGQYDDVLGAALHPYTRALAAAVPVPDPTHGARRRVQLAGEAVPAPGSAAVTSGCPYRPRCPLAEAECALSRPELVEIRPGHRVACHVAKRDASVPAAEQA
ncbi:MAG: ABC transporter ATP-binding protein [Acidimicrobiales bacterium]